MALPIAHIIAQQQLEETSKKTPPPPPQQDTEKGSTYLERVSKSFFSISPHLMLYTKKKMYEDLEQLKQLESDNSGAAEEKKKAISHRLDSALHEGFRVICKEQGIPMENALVPTMFRFCAFVPNNALIAYILLAIPNLPFLQLNSAVRFAIYNAYNRLYCVGLDFCHRSVLPQDYEILQQPFYSRFSM